MKLIIQIPCLNEAETLPAVLADIPREIGGFTGVEILVIDDGSEDATAEIAIQHGADHVLRLPRKCGLAKAFAVGLIEAVRLGADVIVNTDGDGQYRGADIPLIVSPILTGRADLVIGERPIASIKHFSAIKKVLQYLGSSVVRAVSGASVGDAPSGFRAFSRDTALRLNTFNSFTYTIETIVQAGLSNLTVISVPITVNPPTRPSRLFRSAASYVIRSLCGMVAAYLIYKPTKLFSGLAVVFGAAAAFLAGRYMLFVLCGEGAGHVQSVIAAGVMFVCAVFMAALGVIAHLLGINRRLLEELRYLGLVASFADRHLGPLPPPYGKSPRNPPSDREVVHA